MVNNMFYVSAKDTSDLEFESGYSKYKKIVESSLNVYTHFVSRSTGELSTPFLLK